MPRVHVFDDLDKLAADCRQIPDMLRRKGTYIVRRDAQKGCKLAQANATRTAGRHGRHYPSSIKTKQIGAMEVEYGPSRANGMQGGMSFEHGSRNQPPHLDLAKSADVIGPEFYNDVSDMLDDLFWP